MSDCDYLDGMDVFYPPVEDEPEDSYAHQEREAEWRDDIDTAVDGPLTVTVDLDLVVRYEHLIRETLTNGRGTSCEESNDR